MGGKTTSDVIELLSDDDDDDKDTPSSNIVAVDSFLDTTSMNRSSIMSKNPRLTATRGDTVCLLDDSDDDEEEEEQTKPSASAYSTIKEVRATTTATTQPQSPPPQYTSIDTPTPSTTKLKAAASSTTRSTPMVNPYLSNNARKRKQQQPRRSTANYDDSSDEEEDEVVLSILRAGTAFSSNKSPLLSLSQSSQTAATTVTLPSPPAKRIGTSNHRGLTLDSPLVHLPRQQPIKYPTTLPHLDKHTDLRPSLVLAWWRYARIVLVNKAHERPRLEKTVQRMIQLAIGRSSPVRSLNELLPLANQNLTQAASALGNGGGASSTATIRNKKEEWERQLAIGGFGGDDIPPNMGGTREFLSISEACLVVLYENAQKQNQNSASISSLKDRSSWMSFRSLLPAIDRRLSPMVVAKLVRQTDPDGLGLDYYLQPSTRSVEWMQVTKLEQKACLRDDRARIKKHSYRGEFYYELLEAGYEDAQRILNRQYPEAPGPLRAYVPPAWREPLDSSPRVWMAIDNREGGGTVAKWVMHDLCNRLEKIPLPYVCVTLKIGDYAFFHKNSLLPILIERKSIEDVASSMSGDRWVAQKRRMYQGQYIFGYSHEVSTSKSGGEVIKSPPMLIYLIEGNLNKQQVSGGLVGQQRFGLTAEQVEQEVSSLREEGFHILRTSSRENSMFELRRLVKRVTEEVAKGTMVGQYTYAGFIDELKKIPKNTDFSRLAKYYANLRRQALESMPEEERPLGIVERFIMENNKNSALLNPRAAGSKESKPQAKNKDTNAFDKVSTKALKDMCKMAGLSFSGTRADLIERYQGPHPPALWLQRKQRGQYVPPRHNVASTALLVALFLHERDLERNQGTLTNYTGMTKDELYAKTESLCITKNPFSGGTTQTGPYHYDGWSSMPTLLSGDPALVIKSKSRFRLTRSCDIAGYSLASALHEWCHEHGNCNCQEE